MQGHITGEQLLEMSSQLMGHVELIKGKIIQMPPAGYAHGRLTHRLGLLLGKYVEMQHLGEMCGAETGFYTSRNPDTVRAPDAAFISKARIPAETYDGYLETVPDLTIEVVSPRDRPQAILDKVDECFAAGVKCIWVVYPKRRQVYVYTPGQPVEILGEGDTLTGGDVVPGFQCTVAQIFR